MRPLSSAPCLPAPSQPHAARNSAKPRIVLPDTGSANTKKQLPAQKQSGDRAWCYLIKGKRSLPNNWAIKDYFQPRNRKAPWWMLERGGWEEGKRAPVCGRKCIEYSQQTGTIWLCAQSVLQEREKAPSAGPLTPRNNSGLCFPPTPPNLRVAFPGAAGPGRGAFPRGGCTVPGPGCNAVTEDSLRAASPADSQVGPSGCVFQSKRGF